MKKLILLLVFLLLLQWAPVQKGLHYGLMLLNNLIHAQDSVQSHTGLQVDIPGGRETEDTDWFPFMLQFNAHDGFTHYIGEDAQLTIVYNFGAYASDQPMSSFYDRHSAYYGAFYGAYLVRLEDGEPFGLTQEGQLKPDQLKRMGAYDYQHLVLRGLGAPYNRLYFNEVMTCTGQETLAGYSDWQVACSTIETRGPLHQENGWHLSYFQYGKPPAYSGESFLPTTLQAKTWVRYFPKARTTVALYVIAPDERVIEETQEDLLSKTVISLPDQ